MHVLCHCLYLINSTGDRKSLEDVCNSVYNQMYIYPILVTLGGLASLTNVIILLRLSFFKKNRSTPAKLYLFSLAVSQFCVSVISIFAVIMQEQIEKGFAWAFLATYLTQPLFNALNCCSAFIISGLSLDRYYAICRPHAYSSAIGRQRMKFASSAALIFSILLYLPNFVYRLPQKDDTLQYWYVREEAYAEIVAWNVWAVIVEILHHVIPSVMVVILNMAILVSMIQRSMDPGLSSARSNPQSHRERRTIYLLVALTFNFLITNLPSAALKVVYTWSGDVCYVHPDLENMRNIFNLFELVGYPCDFFLYFLMNREYRADLCNLMVMCCGRCQKFEISDDTNEGES